MNCYNLNLWVKTKDYFFILSNIKEQFQVQTSLPYIPQTMAYVHTTTNLP